jgi:inhibitor of growth protein 4
MKVLNGQMKEEAVEFKEEAKKEDSLEPILPAQEEKFSSSSRTTRSRSNSISSKEPLYCTCKRVSFGQMIACDYKDCAIEWFHYPCVGLKTQPKGKWYCSKECQAKKSRK